MNRIKTVMLLGLLTALFIGLGQLIGGTMGLIVGFGLALLMNFGSYWFSDRIVLRMYHAQPVDEQNAPELYAIVRRLTERAQMPMPKVYIIPEQVPNAFATGRNPHNAAVVVTEGLLQVLNPEEIAGVLAHELGHVKNRDTLIMTVAGTLAGALSMLANFAYFIPLGSSDDDDGPNPLVLLLGVILAPFAAMLIQMAISRSREFLADAAGAEMTGNPLALANALRKIEAWSQRGPMHSGSPATAHLFIINPFAGARLANLFSTHPATAMRVARLEEMARSGHSAA
jgi:heat shock protein HtpX